jgi:hypothetical protein
MKTQGLSRRTKGWNCAPVGINALLRARVGRDDHGQAVVFGHRIQHRHQLGKVALRVDVLFTVGADHKVLPLLQIQALQHVEASICGR